MNPSLEKQTQLIREEAYRLGFEGCGFAKAEFMDEEARRLESWLMEGRHGSMQWMENHFDKRVDPTKLVPGAKSVVSVVCQYISYEAIEEHRRPDVPKISKYALGEDYHTVLKKKLFALFEFTRSTVGSLEGRVFVDSAPVLDKAWAQRSGLGWLGKNGNLLNRSLGSWFFIGEMIVDAPFSYDTQVKDHCGSCTRCLDACPTQAIYEPYKVDANKCISYLTIELREAIPEPLHEQMGAWMYGCDICQDVCPWNRKSARGRTSELLPNPDLLGRNTDFWEELSLQEYRTLFKGSAVKRTKYDGLKRNISAIAPNLKSK